MDLFGAITVLAALNGVERDNRDPFELMPENIKSITLKHRNKTVDIPKTVENLLNNPEFICSDIKNSGEMSKKTPKDMLLIQQRNSEQKSFINNIHSNLKDLKILRSFIYF